MTRLSSLILLSATALVFAAPALAKISVQGAENLCKAEINKASPAPKSVKVDRDETRATGEKFVYTFRVKLADDSAARMQCTVDRTTEAVSGVKTLAD